MIRCTIIVWVYFHWSYNNRDMYLLYLLKSSWREGGERAEKVKKPQEEEKNTNIDITQRKLIKKIIYKLSYFNHIEPSVCVNVH